MNDRPTPDDFPPKILADWINFRTVTTDALVQELARWIVDCKPGTVIVHPDDVPEADRLRNLDWIDGWNDCRNHIFTTKEPTP